jgi:RNA polymerase sigma-70 factor (ECF subfamily)
MPTTSRPSSALRCCADEDPSDEALIVAVACGEAGAEGAFVHRFQHLVYGLAKAIIGDQVQAEDVAEEALTRAWRQAGTFDPHGGSARKWLLRITRNLAVEAVRRERLQPLDHRVVISLGDRGRRLPDEPDDSATQVAESNPVLAGLRQIPSAERRALVLATFYGYAAEDISETDGVSLSEARNRLHSGLTKLRGLLPQAEPLTPATESCI